MTEDLDGAVAVVTGASRGIGRGVAVELARRGFDVVATMRDPAAGRELVSKGEPEGWKIRVEPLDVTRPETILLPEGLQVLVNNAGVEASYLPVETSPADMWRQIFETNVFGLLEVTRRAIPLMRTAGGGVLCNVTSSSILAPVPFYAAYRSSKAAVSAIGESLRAELLPFGIRVVEILPGPIATDMYALSERPPEAMDEPDYRALAERVVEMRTPVSDMVTSVEDAARDIVDAILDAGGPLRYGCDRLSRGLLAQWRKVSDEEMMTSMLP
jgi:NAD(P)-dependent dehydrogenase (short-subunit alcohol dehydrogenase family)